MLFALSADSFASLDALKSIVEESAVLSRHFTRKARLLHSFKGNGEKGS
jgi:hypothetical protein